MALIVGGDSFVGRATADHLARREVGVITTTRHIGGADDRTAYLDLGRPLAGWVPPSGVGGACICAAAARLADCADDPVGTAHINVEQTLTLVDRLVAHDVFVVFLSSNQVFDGTLAHMPAHAAHCPVSEYGRQKAAAERSMIAKIEIGAPIAILRLAKVVSAEMPLVEHWKAALRSGDRVGAFSDMRVAPVPVDMVATAIESLLSAHEPGIYQLSGPRDITYLELARSLAAGIGADGSLVDATRATDIGLPVGATPLHTTLDSTAMRECSGISIPDIDELIATRLA